MQANPTRSTPLRSNQSNQTSQLRKFAQISIAQQLPFSERYPSAFAAAGDELTEFETLIRPPVVIPWTRPFISFFLFSFLSFFLFPFFLFPFFFLLFFSYACTARGLRLSIRHISKSTYVGVLATAAAAARLGLYLRRNAYECA